MYLLKEYTIYISELFYKWGKLVVFAIVFLYWRIITARILEISSLKIVCQVPVLLEISFS